MTPDGGKDMTSRKFAKPLQCIESQRRRRLSVCGHASLAEPMTFPYLSVADLLPRRSSSLSTANVILQPLVFSCIQPFELSIEKRRALTTRTCYCKVIVALRGTKLEELAPQGELDEVDQHIPLHSDPAPSGVLVNPACADWHIRRWGAVAFGESRMKMSGFV